MSSRWQFFSGTALFSAILLGATLISPSQFANAMPAVEGVLNSAPTPTDFSASGSTSADIAVDGIGGSDGYHLRVARESAGFVWSDIAVIDPSGIDQSTWYGYQCVTADGKYAAVAVLPGGSINSNTARDRGAYAYGVDLTSGTVSALATGVGLKYHSPQCGIDDSAVFTSALGTAKPETEVLRADLSTGKEVSQTVVNGQLTSASPVGSMVLAAAGEQLVTVANGGTADKPVDAANALVLPGGPYDIRPSADGGVDFLSAEPDGQTSDVWHHKSGPATKVATGPTSALSLDLGRGGKNLIVGAQDLPASSPLVPVAVSALPAGVGVVSLDAHAAFGPAKAAPVADSGATSDVNTGSAQSGQALVESLSTHQVFDASKEPVVSGTDSRSPAGSTQSTGALLPGAATSSNGNVPQLAPKETGTRSSFTSTGPATMSIQTANYIQPTAASASSAVPAVSPGATTPKCSVARLQPTLEAMQPSNGQVDWASQMAEQGLLTGASSTRPANFANMGLAAYSPSSDFPPIALSHPSSSSWASVPRSVMTAIAAQESNFNQASWHAVPGQAGDPLIADYYGSGDNIDAIDYPDADCGYGVAQVTSGMAATDTSISAHGQMKVAVDYQENLAAGLNILEQTWNQLYAAGITVNGGDPKFLENWYFAAWAYNTGIQPTAAFGNTTNCTPSATCTGPDGTWGLGWSNNPKNPDYDPARAPYLKNTYADASHPSSWPYQERILGWMGAPIIRYGYTAYDTPSYNGGSTWLQVPASNTFCTSANLCDASHVVTGNPSANYCTLADDECWWHSPVTTITSCSTTCATSAYEDAAGSTEPAYTSQYQPTCNLDTTKVPTTSSGAPIIVDDLATPSQNRQGCSGMNWSNNGTFTYTPGANSSGDPVGNIDTHQLGSGLGGHIFFTHTEPASATTLINTGTWTPNLPSLQYYKIKLHLPVSGATATDVVYTINPGGGVTPWKIRVNQDWESEQWVTIGTFAMQNGGNVTLNNISALPAQEYDVAFDAVAFVPQGGTPGTPIGGPPTIQDAPKGSNPAFINCGCATRTAGDPVNTQSGYYGETDTDLSTPGLGEGLAVTRSYSSSLADPAGPSGSTGYVNGAFGYGWTYNYGMTATTNATSGNVMIKQEDGSAVTFTPISGGGYATTAPRFDATLTKTGSTYAFTRHAQDQFVFDTATGRLTSESDLAGRTATPTYSTALAYDASGNIFSVTDPAGRVYTFLWSGTHIIRVSTSGDQEVNYNYDASGNLVTAFGVGTTRTGTTLNNADRADYAYTSTHLLNAERSPANYGKTGTPTPVMSMSYDASERVTLQTTATGDITTFKYGPYSSPTLVAGQTLVTDGASHQTLYTYQGGLLTSMTKGYGASGASTWAYTYDPVSLGVSVQTNPDGSTQTFSYDDQGHLTSSSDGLGRTTSNSYDTAGHLLRSISPDGLQTTNTYNPAGAPTSSVLSLPGQSAEQAGTSGSTATRSASATYTNAALPALPTNKTDVAGSTTTYAYDSFGEVSSETDAASHLEKFAYNSARGILTTSVSPTGAAAGTALTCTPPAVGCTTYVYDIYGHITKTTDALGHFTAATFDADGNRLTNTDANTHTTTTVYDASDRPTSSTKPSTAVATTAYNGDNTVRSTTDAATHATSYTYDAQGREATSVDPDNKATTYGYDLDGRLTSQTQPTGDVITQVWDNANELTGITYSGTSTHAVAYTYDPAGRRVTMSDATGTNTYSHDRFGDTTTVAAGSGPIVGYGYDAAGRVTTIAYPGTNNTISQHYNAIGQMDSITDPAGLITGFGYNPDGAPTTTTYPNGVTATTGYYNADQPTTSTLAKGATALGTLTYTRDNTGDLTGRTATSGAAGGNYAYGYTPNQYLSTSTTGGATTTLGYDVVGNPISLGTGTQVFDPAGKLCWTSTTAVTTPSCATPATGATAYAYDNNGQRTTLTPGTGTATHYNWNAAGELTSLTGATAATYLYNGDGLRTKKLVGSNTTNFVWNTTASVPTMLTDGTLDYVYGPTGSAIEQYTAGGGSPAFYFNDAHGSTTALTGSAGTVVATYAYNPEGKTTAHTGTTMTPLQFGGQYSDAETGFTYLRSRFYDPATAMFLSVDAFVSQTRDAYRYAGDDPINFLDPLGLWGWADTWAVVGMVGLAIAGVALTASIVGSAGDAGVLIGEGALGEVLAEDAAAEAVEEAGSNITVGRVAGAAGTGIDATDCAINHNRAACVAAMFGAGALGADVGGAAMSDQIAGFGVRAVGGIGVGAAGGVIDANSGIEGAKHFCDGQQAENSGR